MILKVPSKPNHSVMILWYSLLHCCAHLHLLHLFYSPLPVLCLISGMFLPLSHGTLSSLASLSSMPKSFSSSQCSLSFQSTLPFSFFLPLNPLQNLKTLLHFPIPAPTLSAGARSWPEGTLPSLSIHSVPRHNQIHNSAEQSEQALALVWPSKKPPD